MSFDDGQKVYFQTPPGELSGLTYGDRKLNLIQSGFFIDPKNHLFCEIKYQEDVGFFGKAKWKYIDQFEGDFLTVSEDFVL